jgi:hypothetical protein
LEIDEGKPKVVRPLTKTADDASAILRLVGICTGILIETVAFERVVHENGELSGGGGHGFRFANPVGKSAIEGAERRLRPAERHGGQPEDRRRAVGGRLRATAEEAAAGDFVLGGQGEPGMSQ